MKGLSFIIVSSLALLTTTGLAGCSEGCRDGASEAFDVKYINETDQDYFIYLDWGTGGFDETEFPPAPSDASAGSTAPGCEFLKDYLHIQIREPKPNQEDIHDPERRGGALVFEGNWTGMQCNQGYVFRYNGPGDVRLYERVPCSTDTWKRDLERVSP